MNQTTIDQLNRLNKDFYDTVHEHFDQTRQNHWTGWLLLLPLIENHLPASISVLDIAAGNCRFGLFLVDQGIGIVQFTGLDLNQPLLEVGSTRLANENIPHTVHHADLIPLLMANSPLLTSGDQTVFDLTVLFGLTHHIPSYQLRLALLQSAARHTAPGGLVAATFWQFMDEPGLKSRVIEAKQVPGLAGHDLDLEPGDHFLDWRAGSEAIRYCHYSGPEERADLIAALAKHDLELIEEFEADGPNGRTNHYLVWKKNSPAEKS